MTFIKRERNDHRSLYHVVSAVLSKLSWAAATSLCIYFLFIYAPKHLVSRKTDIPPLLLIHLIGAYSIYLACVHNILITPRCFNGRARPFHVWIGRFGLILGVMGFVSGVIVTWVVNDYTQNMGFSIGITIGGILQMYLQVSGYVSIRHFKKIREQILTSEYKNKEELYALEDKQDTHLIRHISSMINLFVFACGVPAIMRLELPLGYLLLGCALASFLMIRPFIVKLKRKRETERHVEESASSPLLT